MKEVIQELQELRTAPVEPNGTYSSDNCGCNPRKIMDNLIGVHMYSLTHNTVIQVSEKHITIYTEYGRTKVPYKCEDKSEYFQLSMIHDYFGMSYEDFIQLKDIARYMKCRIILDAKSN